jgi:hypothetical protein
VVVPNRKAMSRVLLGRPSKRNPDVAIVTINLLPQHQVAFTNIQDVLHDFLCNHARVDYTFIQPCPFGQAYVKFVYFHDRDQLIHNSPHQFGDVFISFVEHDRGTNRRAVTLNHEVWLMLLGTNIDFWSDVHMNKLLGDHGHIIAWEEDSNHIARVLVKARVVNLEEIPWFIVSTEGPGFNGDSWTIQVEIIQTRMLGGLGPDEDIPPGPDDIQPHFFDFFGFGQPGHGPAFQLQPQQQNHGPAQQQHPGPVHELQGAGWGLWPQGQEDQAQQEAVIVQAIPAAQPLNFDLNQPLDQIDDDLGVVEDIPGHLQPPQQPAEPMEEDIIVASSDLEGGPEIAPVPLAAVQQEVDVFIPMDNGAPLQLIPDEIQEHELLGAPEVNVPVMAQVGNNFEQLGFVELLQPAQDPVFMQRLSPTNLSGCSALKVNPEAIRLWANFLAPVDGASTVQIPKVWADFFTMMLLSPKSFQWAKQFLSSSALEHLAGPLHPLFLLEFLKLYQIQVCSYAQIICHLQRNLMTLCPHMSPLLRMHPLPQRTLNSCPLLHLLRN